MITVENLRKKVVDPTYDKIENFLGDGTTKIFELGKSPSFDEIIKDNNTVVPSANYTLNEDTGYIVFNTAPITAHVIIVQYKYAAFTDDELTDIIADHTKSTDIATLYASAIECIERLMFDSARRFRYQEGQTEMNPEKVFDNLKQMLDKFKELLIESENSGSGARVMNRIHPAYEDEEETQDLTRLT
jgi:hypothetical protein